MIQLSHHSSSAKKHGLMNLKRYMTAMRTDLKAWQQLLPFRQSMPAEHPGRCFVVAVFVSVAIHAFLSFLLWVVVTERTAVEFAAPSIGKPMIVSLVSLSMLAPAPHDGMDREAASVVPNTGPPTQRSQASPKQSRSAERKAEVESVVTSKDQVGAGSEAPDGKSLTIDTIPSIDLEAAHHITREVGGIPESEAETVVSLKGQGVPGPEAPKGNAIATGATPSFDLEAAYRIAREVGREWAVRSEFITQSPRFTSRKLYLKNHLGIIRAPRPDCRTAHQEGAFIGFLSIPFLLKDTITDSGCEWKRQEDRERGRGRERKVGKERWWDQTKESIFGEFAYPIDTSGNLSW